MSKENKDINDFLVNSKNAGKTDSEIRNEFLSFPSRVVKPPKKKKAKIDKEIKENKKNKLIAAAEYLEKLYDFRFNVVAQKTEFREKDSPGFKFFDKRTYDKVIMDLKMEAGIDISRDDFDSLIGGPMSEDYDPLKEFIFSIKPWDRQDHIKYFLQQIQLKNEDLRPHLIKYFTKWFVSFVASIIDDHIINENCFVLSGPQGKGKTRFLLSMVPKHLQLYYTFSGNFNVRDKDHLEMLGTKILIILDEMATLTRTDVESMKNTMSMRHVDVRRAYGRVNSYFYRRASFCGSINDIEFLTDLTGNRRWLPFLIDNITVDESYDITLIYSQALELTRNKDFIYYLKSNEIQELEEYNEQFRRRSPEEELLSIHFKIPGTEEIEGGYNIVHRTTTEIVNELASRELYKKMNVNDSVINRMGKALVKAGYQKKNVKRKGDKYPVRVWILKQIDLSETEKFKRGEAEESVESRGCENII